MCTRRAGLHKKTKMASKEKDKRQWWKEGLVGLWAGSLFGVTSVAIGQPFDTIKTKMQTQSGYQNKTMLQTIKATLRSQGPVGFYRGSPFPFFGSTFYRSAQFGAYESIYSYLEGRYGQRNVLFKKYRLHALLGGLGGATARAVIETPLEYAKIRLQTQRDWKLRDVYKGFGITWLRTTIFLSSFFYLREAAKTRYPKELSHPILGPFLLGGVVATFAWWVVWPLELMKSQVQGSYNGSKNFSVLHRMRLVVSERGLTGLYRGVFSGTLRSFFANGIGLIVYEYVQRRCLQVSN